MSASSVALQQLAVPLGYASSSRAVAQADAAAARPGRPLVGIGLIIASTVFFSCSDVITKELSSSLPAVEIAWLRYLCFSLLLLPAILHGGVARALRSARPQLQIGRGLATVCSALLFTLGLRFLPVAEASATNFVAPLFITALSIPLLGEVIGWRRWTATLIGFAGVLLVVRPGTSAFDPASIFPLLAALCWAFAAISTRKMSGVDRPITTLAYSAFIGLLVLSLLLPFNWVMPTSRELVLGAALGLLSTAGHGLVVLAFRHAAASVLAPFSYVQLVGSGVLAFLIFGAVPDAWTCVGGAVIAASGLYTAHREQVRARERAAEGPRGSA